MSETINPPIHNETLLDSVEISASARSIVAIPRILEKDIVGDLGLHVIVTGSGTLKIDIQQSNTGETNEWVATTLEEGMTAGQDLIAINVTLSAYAQLYFYNIDSGSSITVTAVLAMR